MTARCSICRTRSVPERKNDLRSPQVTHHTADCPENIRNRRSPVGEYVPEIRTEAGWIASMELDPVEDYEDMTSERDAHNLRLAVAAANRNDLGLEYRVRYVKA